MHKKKVLIVGSGGREHALAWKLASSPRVSRVFCAPGNAGMEAEATCVPVQASDLEGLVSFAKKEGVGLTIVGPEAPLAQGLADRFTDEGLVVFGPTKAAAEIEASKVFAKELLHKSGIPTGSFKVFTEAETAIDHIRKVGPPIVIKADGLAAGKGVILARALEEAEDAVNIILREKAFGPAGNRLLVEEFLTGEEASFMAITDGETVLPLASSQDHKAVFDNDQGPNTGGMGAYSPAPVVTDRVFRETMDFVMEPTVRAMERENRPYRGVLYGGLMIEKDRPKVLEFNCRFGDPEAQPILMRLRTDLLDLFEAAVEGRLAGLRLDWDPRAAVCIVLASRGYPGKYETGKPIHGLDDVASMKDVMVFHAGTARENGRFVTKGGRVLGVTALGDTISDAIDRAYAAVDKISFEGMHFRRDIGKKALRHVTGSHSASGQSTSTPTAQVGIVMGSISDREVMEEARRTLNEFGVSCEIKILSAHRSPELAVSYAREAESRGVKTLIAGAGMAAHLAGALAAHTTLPVIGVPIDSPPLNGLDALLSTVQMPPGVPVATMAIGKAGAKNAAMLAIEILALSEPNLKKKIRSFRVMQARKIAALNQEL
jgi:phosphoribosylamine--glycine ligase